MSWIHNTKILVTGASGFIGRNLVFRLRGAGYNGLITIDRNSSLADLEQGPKQADFTSHLARVNHPVKESESGEGNSNVTQQIVDVLKKNNKNAPIMLSFSIQAECGNAYGKSRATAEKIIQQCGETASAKYYTCRLPNVFGKWCYPNYNSFIATFCHRIANDETITINDPSAIVDLVYIDDFCSDILELLEGANETGYGTFGPIYSATIGEMAQLIYRFRESRQTLITEDVGDGFTRTLYSAQLSYLPPEQFAYTIPSYNNDRGVSCEVLKTKSADQFSFFTAHPGITRGGRYHRSKNEKFTVIRGSACFKFENIAMGERCEFNVSSDNFKIVETVPGWTYDIINNGSDELVVILWANEIFNRSEPDTMARVLS